MMQLKKILFIALVLCLVGSYVYAYDGELLSVEAIKSNIENDYGINIIIHDDGENINYKECLLVIDKGLKRFPEGIIKEITQHYSKSKIETNIILSKTEKVSDLFSEYKLIENSANIYINTLQNSLYFNTCVASEEGFVHEMGRYISDYLFKVYGYDNIKNEFEKLNSEYVYGSWGEGYDKIFINKHSSLSFENEIVDLIWYTEIRPNILRNINNGNYTVIHQKIQYLATVIDKSFESITFDLKLWHEALPQNPDSWALEAIQKLNDASLIPEELDGIYNSYITKEDFYTLTFNLLEHKFGNEEFIRTFDLINYDKHVAMDPVKGEVFVDNDCENLLEHDLETGSNKEKRLYEAFQLGLIDNEWLLSSKNYITRLEISKLFIYISNELGMDISEYEVIEYDDLLNVKGSEKPFIYFVSSKGLLNGDGASFNPFSNCTYQEAYLILMRFYNML